MERSNKLARYAGQPMLLIFLLLTISSQTLTAGEIAVNTGVENCPNKRKKCHF